MPYPRATLFPAAINDIVSANKCGYLINVRVKISFFYNHNKHSARYTSAWNKYLLLFFSYAQQLTSSQKEIVVVALNENVSFYRRKICVCFILNRNIWLIKFWMNSHKTETSIRHLMEYLESECWKKNIFKRFNVEIKWDEFFEFFARNKKHMKFTLCTP